MQRWHRAALFAKISARFSLAGGGRKDKSGVIDSTFANGIFALAGAIKGGGLTGVFTLWVEWRRSRRDNLHEEKERHRVVKQAAWVVDAELEQAERSAGIAVERGQWWAKEIGPLDVGSWNQFRAILAAELPLDSWRVIASAFGFVHGINSAWAIAFAERQLRNYTIETTPQKRMSEDEQKRVPFGIEEIRKGRRCLGNLLED